MSDRIVLNQPAVLDVIFTVSGSLTDPTTLSLLVTAPDGTTNTYTYAGATITRVSLGTFTKTVTANQIGVWSYVWTGTGTAADVQDGTFTVFAAVPLNLYCQLDELKSWGFPSITDASDDAGLLLAAQSVSRWIESYCQRRFWKGTATRLYSPESYYELDIDDLVSVTTLKTDAAGDGTYETTWTADTDYQLYPFNPAEYPETHPYTKIRTSGSLTFPVAWSRGARRDLVQLVGVFGWPAIPDAVKQAALIMSSKIFERWKSTNGVFGGFDNFGAVRVGTRLDPDVEMLLAPYRKYAVMIG